ncbi:MAG: hypothetical protein LBD59_11090 [Prevotellaceae bacterium]|jgi:hypothetical protein|nr:hypothetical protein [Prevotellaceae bacterium]
MVALLYGATIFSCSTDTVEKVSYAEILERPEEEAKNLKIIYTNKGILINEVFAKTAIMNKRNDTALYIFPEGLHVNSYKMMDSVNVLETTLVADSATLKEKPNFFTAIGNVVARNLLTKKRLETEGPLYWDEKNKTIETFVFSTIYTETDTIYAKSGISSDDAFRDVLIRQQSGVVLK